ESCSTRLVLPLLETELFATKAINAGADPLFHDDDGPRCPRNLIPAGVFRVSTRSTLKAEQNGQRLSPTSRRRPLPRRAQFLSRGCPRWPRALSRDLSAHSSEMG